VLRLPRHVREESTDTTTETFMAGNYVKTIARGWRLHQPFDTDHGRFLIA
jgi:hypothetical protein